MGIEKELVSRDIALKGKDAAIVIREDGENAELYYPRMEDPNELLPSNVLVLVALSFKLRNPAFVEELMTWFSGMVEKENQTGGLEPPKTIN